MIPTAEELMLKHIPLGIQNIKGSGDGKPQYNAEKDIIQTCMIEFAKVHLQAQLDAVLKNIRIDETTKQLLPKLRRVIPEDIAFDWNLVINAYPINDIK